MEKEILKKRELFWQLKARECSMAQLSDMVGSSTSTSQCFITVIGCTPIWYQSPNQFEQQIETLMKVA